MTRRSKQFILMLTDEEHEYLVRLAHFKDITASGMLRRRVYDKDWRDDLQILRSEQKQFTLEQLDRRHRKRG